MILSISMFMMHIFYHEIFWCGMLHVILLRMICYKCHNVDLYDHREQFWCVISNCLLLKMTFHRNHTDNLSGHHEWYWCVSSDVMLQRSWLSKWFCARVTFVITHSFMKCLDVKFQRLWGTKIFSTRFTFVISLVSKDIFHFSMNNSFVSIFVWIRFFWWIHFKIQNNTAHKWFVKHCWFNIPMPF